jgi:hypothetical protein
VPAARGDLDFDRFIKVVVGSRWARYARAKFGVRDCGHEIESQHRFVNGCRVDRIMFNFQGQSSTSSSLGRWPGTWATREDKGMSDSGGIKIIGSMVR